tara:strand:- start:249 stop:701 length:453 start_codon:yes stop_codon:yes gene_type:complete
MSSNRLIYDQCEYDTRVAESTGTLAYMLDSSAHENNKKCRIELGIVGGNNVSLTKGNLIDVESDLKGVTRKASLCPSRKYRTKCATSDCLSCQPENIVIDGPGCDKPREVDTDLVHLPSCNMFRYKPTPLPKALDFPACPVRQPNRCDKN